MRKPGISLLCGENFKPLDVAWLPRVLDRSIRKVDLDWLSRFLDCKLEKRTVNTPGAYHRKSTEQRILLLVTKLNATVEVGLAAAGANEGDSATVIGERPSDASC